MRRRIFPRSPRTLHKGIAELGHAPGHVELLNLLARGAGIRNCQHLRADAQARQRLDAPPPPAAPLADHARCEKAARLFDAEGRLIRWPKKRNLQILCLWVMWSHLPAGTISTEREVNERLNAWHLFGDHAILRREMVEFGLDAPHPRRARIYPHRARGAAGSSPCCWRGCGLRSS